MALPYEDLFSGTIKGLYVNLVEIAYTYPEGNETVYLNDSGCPVQFRGHAYIPVSFEVTEPDKASIEEGSGTLAIAGVPSHYVRRVQEAIPEDGIIVSVALVKLVNDNGTLIVEGDSTILPFVEYEVDSVTMQSATGTLSLSLKTGGVLGYTASKYIYSSTLFPGLCG